MKSIITMDEKEHKNTKLSELHATAICGNDILSSSLYVSGIAAIFAGIYAPIVLLMVAGVLYLYRKVYTEAVEALPVNGGAYNCLLNGTSKTVAAIAGVMTFLSYIATAVISAKVAVEYLHTLVPFPVIISTITLLFIFALLVISGLKDSAKVALVIFTIHLISLILFLLLGAIDFFSGNSLFSQNSAHTSVIIMGNGGLIKTLILAFSASLLGVSGFESSANFVEDQHPGVFRKTLRNMWLGVAIFNPLIALVVLNSLPFGAIAQGKDFLLADVAQVIGGTFFKQMIVVDAFLVLSGAVLTSYVGVSGLLVRMASDGCLPGFLTTQNKRGAYSSIVIAFFLLCSSILVITKGKLLSLAGVYTIAFLGVMSMFAFGNLILKKSRPDLKRTYKAPIAIVLLALASTLLGIIGNILIDVDNVSYFMLYFIPFVLFVLCIIDADDLLRWGFRICSAFPALHYYLGKNFRDLIDGQFVIFIHHANRLYPALDYISKNETGRQITIVHCKDHDDDGEHDLKKECEELTQLTADLQKSGAFTRLKITVTYKEKPFGPEIVEEVSKELGIRNNRMMIGSIHKSHYFDYEELGGVRIII